MEVDTFIAVMIHMALGAPLVKFRAAPEESGERLRMIRHRVAGEALFVFDGSERLSVARIAIGRDHLVRISEWAAAPLLLFGASQWADTKDDRHRQKQKRREERRAGKYRR